MDQLQMNLKQTRSSSQERGRNYRNLTISFQHKIHIVNTSFSQLPFPKLIKAIAANSQLRIDLRIDSLSNPPL